MKKWSSGSDFYDPKYCLPKDSVPVVLGNSLVYKLAN